MVWSASNTFCLQCIWTENGYQTFPFCTLHSFFQIKVDIPPECRIYPIESEDEEEESRAAFRGGVGAKEIICPWESLTTQNGTG